MDRRSLLVLFGCLALACAPATAQPVLAEKSFRGKTFAKWQALLQHPDAKSRSRAATVLGLGPFGRMAVPPLIEALADRDFEVRLSAAIALGNRGPEAAEAIPALLDALDGHNMRYESERALLRIGPAAIPILLEEGIIGGGPSFFTPSFIAMGPAALPPLITALTAKEQYTREQAASILAKFGPEAVLAVPALVQALGDQDCSVRLYSTVALACLGPRALSAAPALRLLLADPDETVRSVADEALRTMDPCAAIPLLLETARKEKYPEKLLSKLANLGPSGVAALSELGRGADTATRIRILTVLGQERVAPLPLMLQGLNDRVPELRLAAAAALSRSEVDLAPVLPRLLEALEKENAEIAGAIVQAIGRICPVPPRALSALGAALRHRHDEVAKCAAEQLEHLAGAARPALSSILAALHDHRPEVRCRALSLLARVAPAEREVVQALCAALNDEDSGVRTSAARELGSLGPPARAVAGVSIPLPLSTGSRAAGSATGEMHTDLVAAALRARLKDSRADVRLAAAEALGRLGLGDAAVVDALAWELADLSNWHRDRYDSTPRARAATALRDMGPAAARAVPMLALALWDRNAASVREAAADALRAMGPAARQAIPALACVLRRDDHWAKQAAAAALVAAGGEGLTPFPEKLAGGEKLIQLFYQRKEPAPAFLVPELLELLDRGDWGARCAAVEILGRVRAPGSQGQRALVRTLSDESREVRQQACATLGALGAVGQFAIPALSDLLLDRNPEVRVAAALSLQRIGPDARIGLPALVESLTDPDEEVRRQAARTLGMMGTKGRPARTALRAACRDRAEPVRLAAELAVAHVEGGREQVVRTLLTRLETTRGDVRIAATQALWELNCRRELVPQLVRMIEEEGPHLKTVDLLRQLNHQTEDVAAFVRPLLRHKRYTVREAAQRILSYSR
jgi:HEAT repeat protein